MGEVAGLFRVKGRGAFDGADGAESASSGAFLPGDHERGIAACPTLVDVGASRFFANGVELIVLHRRFRGVEHGLLVARGEGGSKPFGETTFWG